MNREDALTAFSANAGQALQVAKGRVRILANRVTPVVVRSAHGFWTWLTYWVQAGLVFAWNGLLTVYEWLTRAWFAMRPRTVRAEVYTLYRLLGAGQDGLPVLVRKGQEKNLKIAVKKARECIGNGQPYKWMVTKETAVVVLHPRRRPLKRRD